MDPKYKPLIGWASKQLEYMKEFDNNSSSSNNTKKKKQKIHHHPCNMTAMQNRRLHDIGFYNMDDDERSRILDNVKWEKNFKLLQEYKELNGDQLEIEFKKGGKFVGDLLMNEAPKTCTALLNVLPAEVRFRQARFAG